jgi:signal transduction histidine kinase
MSLATRLVIGLVLVVAVVMAAYGVTSLRQRTALMSAGLARETAALARALQVVSSSALRSHHEGDLDRVLRRVLRDSEVEIGVVVDGAGRVIAGGARGEPGCVPALLAAARAAPGGETWGRCGGRVRAVALPVEAPGAWLLVARRTAVLDRDEATSRRRILVTTVVLTVLASLAIVGVLRAALTRPLSAVLAGVRGTGGPGLPRPVEVPRSARELRELALAFNEMVERREGKQRALVREARERVELEQRLRRAETFAAIGRLAGGLAHEIGSPLGVIGLRADAIHDDPSASAAAREHAAVVASQVERIAGRVRDLLHLAHRHEVDRSVLDLRQVVRAVGEAVAAEAETAGTDLVVRVPEREVCVAGDGVLLRHALHNVVVNALQALRPGGGRVEVDLRRAGEVARIAVEDDGPGIDPDRLDAVAQPFYTTKDVGEGSGLGLAITSGILEEHGGVLTLVPGRERGLRVYLDLPTAGTEDGSGA